MSDNALINVEGLGGDLIVSQEQELLGELASGAGFLPYIQLFTLKSGAVAEGHINGGHYGLVKDGQIIDLGKEINVIPVSVRARAFYKDGNNITIVFDKNDAEFQRIADLQANKVQGAMTGPEVLMWLPSQNTFATFFCGSPTLKKEARKWGPFMAKAMTLKAKLIDKGQHKWHGPVTVACSLSLSPLPSNESVTEEVQKFKNPRKITPGEAVQQGATDQVVR